MTGSSLAFGGLPLLDLVREFEAHVQEKLQKRDVLPRILRQHPAIVAFVQRLVPIEPQLVSPILQNCGDLSFCGQFVDALLKIASSRAQFLGDHVEGRSASREYEEVAPTFRQKLSGLIKDLCDLWRPGGMSRDRLYLRVGGDDPKIGNQAALIGGTPAAHDETGRRLRDQRHEHHREETVWTTRKSANFHSELSTLRRLPHAAMGIAIPQGRLVLRIELAAHNLAELVNKEIFVLPAMWTAVSNLEECHANL